MGEPEKVQHIFRFRPERPAERVTLRGDFVDWFRQHRMLQAEDGAFEVRLDLEPGGYAYKFLISNAEWACDRSNPRTECSEPFHQNSLLVVRGIWISGDYQFVLNPAYNRDRGPANVYSLRLRLAR